MSNNPMELMSLESFASQPCDANELTDTERDALIITAIEVNGEWVILSRFGDDTWKLGDVPSNVPACRKSINFIKVPSTFRAVMKAIFYRQMRHGRAGSTQPSAGTTHSLFSCLLPFLRYLENLKIESLSLVSPIIAANYVNICKGHNANNPQKPKSPASIMASFTAIEAIYELSQSTDQPMLQHPWPDTTARALALAGGVIAPARTPLMPDDVFCTLFSQAYKQLECSQLLFELRDALDVIESELKGRSKAYKYAVKTRYLKRQDWNGGIKKLSISLTSLRTACYIVLASTSGCRNHELANLQVDAHTRTEDDEGTIYHWMHSKSEKTDEGIIRWMIPEAAVRALRIMERWSAPYRAMIADEITYLHSINPHHPQISDAIKHRNSIFLGIDRSAGNRVRTLTCSSWKQALEEFAKDCGLSWKISSHQFRRKFANYVAHSKFGDLRYLKEHFAHWSLDMTLGYAMDDTWGQHLNLDLYDEIQEELADIKVNAVGDWIENERLAGGYGISLKKWQREPQNLLIFKDHAAMIKSIAESTSIRSNGHAWCTADNGGCIGNTIERTRCGGCEHSVIGRSHAPMYQRLYDDLKGLKNCADIGEAGRQRVERDLSRSQEVLLQLGIPSEDLIT